MRNAMWVGGGITGMGEIPMLGVREKGIAKVIRDIFRSGEQGFFYDPSDLKTRYQDAAGTTTVNASGQPVGLLLDKGKGISLGPELIINGNFSDSSNWFVTNVDDTHFVDFTADGARFYSASNTPIMQLRPSATLVPGKWYRIEVTTSGNVIGAIKSDGFIPGNLVLSGTQAGTYVTYAQARGTALFILRNSAVVDLTIKSVSVKEVLGNHAYQTTSAARPILQQPPILGNELVVNGDFDSGLVGWESATDYTSTANVVNGELNVTPLKDSGRQVQRLNLQVGKEYLISGSHYQVSGTSRAYIAIGYGGNWDSLLITSPSRVQSDAVKFSKLFRPTSSDVYLSLSVLKAGTDTVGAFDNISVKEVTGYRTDQNYIAYDDVDDKLITNLPAPLTNVTVLRAIPKVGTQVKYNQTLPVLYEDTTTHAGLIAIDRALTRQEQLRLMTELDKKAGAVGIETVVLKKFEGEAKGVYYDLNDLNTMFQDAYGQVPVTGHNQPVGLLLDKSLQLRVGDVINTTNEAGLLSMTGTEVELIPSTQNARTTTWTDVKPNRIYRINSPISNRFRVQLKSNQGVITSYKGNEDTRSGDARLIRTEANTTQIRIYYVTGIPTGDFSLKLEEILGNHSYQSVSASRPLLSARLNYFSLSNFFNWAEISSSGISSTMRYLQRDIAKAPDGTTTASKITVSTSAGNQRTYLSVNMPIGGAQEYTYSLHAKADTSKKIMLRTSSGAGSAGAIFDLEKGVWITQATSGLKQHATYLGDGWWRLGISGTHPDAASMVPWILIPDPVNNSQSWAGDGTTAVLVWGAQLEYGNVMSPFQETINEVINTKGFNYYLNFDGVDDHLRCDSADLSNAKDVTMILGMKKLLDNRSQSVIEYGSTTGFGILAPGSGGANSYSAFGYKGTLRQTHGGKVGAVVDVAVVTGLITASDNPIKARRNGVEIAKVTESLGDGNFPNGILYLGARSGSTMFFTGHVHSVFMITDQLTPDELSTIEKNSAKLLGVSLNV